MGISNLVRILPRFYYEIEDAKEYIGVTYSTNYEKIYTLGLDEDVTTLAVNTFLELKENISFNISKVYFYKGITDIDLEVFIEATNLDISIIQILDNSEENGLYGLYQCSTTEDSIFIGIDHPKSTDVALQGIFAPIAIGASFGDGSILEVTESKEMSLLPMLRYTGGFFNIKSDGWLVNQLKSNKDNFITNFASISTGKKILSNGRFNGQSKIGYTGGLTCINEFVDMALSSDYNEIDVIVLGSSKPLYYRYKPSKNLNVIINGSGKKILFSKIILHIQRDVDKDPGRTAQGAFISNSIYLQQKKSRYQLKAVECTKCLAIIFPPRKYCKICNSLTKDGLQLSRNAKLYSFTSILKGAAPTEFDYQQKFEGEYIVAIIEFPEGPKVISQMTDVDISGLNVGDLVKMVFRKIYTQDNLDRYGYKFVKK
jgi:uncharacterized protein